MHAAMSLNHAACESQKAAIVGCTGTEYPVRIDPLLRRGELAQNSGFQWSISIAADSLEREAGEAAKHLCCRPTL